MSAQRRRYIAATDYDGTLHLNGEVSGETLATVRKWRERGHLFGLVTGRDLDMIRFEIERWRIPFDFLVCCNGAVIYDADLRELQRRNIHSMLVRPILSHPIAATSLHYEISVSGRTFLCLRSSKSRFPQLGVPYVAISEQEAMSMENPQLISLAFTDVAGGSRCVSMMEQDFAVDLQTHQNGPNVDITTHGVNKAQGLLDLLRIKGWSEKGLLVIGDAENDLPMIRRFQGFTLTSARQIVQEEASALYAGVGEMLRVYLD